METIQYRAGKFCEVYPSACGFFPQYCTPSNLLMVARTVLNNLNSTDGMPTVLDILHSADDTLYSTDNIHHNSTAHPPVY